MTQHSDIAATVTSILAEQAVCDPAEITPEQSLQDLGIDSLGVVECIFAIEETFDVSIPFNANNPEEGGFDISTVGAVITEVEALVKKRHG